jgi:Fe2+ or Zn2+ uptake regulation protein
MRYLEEMRDHPTVDQIYKVLRRRLPSLSRTSVYNALSTLREAGLVRPFSMDGNETLYDANILDHGHFRCTHCGRIYDFDVKLPEAEQIELKGFKTYRRDVLLWGLCPICAEKPECENIKSIN